MSHISPFLVKIDVLKWYKIDYEIFCVRTVKSFREGKGRRRLNLPTMRETNKHELRHEILKFLLNMFQSKLNN
jgi:hypothetical protein